ncbi:MAG: thiamine diphosphokinase [Clostridia bacterium]|nr:thiamine diphosphokinase [Clostridia bacterium]MBQ5742847.1 thiamine diphosphokinase [Clostridia bacterium]
MRWVIFCWSKSDLPPADLRPDDVIVCADSGMEYARRCGITPSIVLGDFDSYSGEIPSDAELIRLPKEKDDTDTMYAVRLGLERGVDEFLIAGGIGGRLDHTLGAVQTLNYLASQGISASMSDGQQWIEVLQAPVEKQYSASHARYFSILALSEQVTGLTLRGFRFPLEHAQITYDYPLGVSNEITEKTATLSAQTGRFAVIRTAD